MLAQVKPSLWTPYALPAFALLEFKLLCRWKVPKLRAQVAELEV